MQMVRKEGSVPSGGHEVAGWDDRGKLRNLKPSGDDRIKHYLSFYLSIDA